MVEQELTYQKLQIPSSDIYEAMGYKDSMPDGMVIEEINTLLDRITPLLRPRFFFFIADGLLDTEKATLTVKDTVLSIAPAFRVRVGVPVPGAFHSREKRRFAVGLRRRCGMLRYFCGGLLLLKFRSFNDRQLNRILLPISVVKCSLYSQTFNRLVLNSSLIILKLT